MSDWLCNDLPHERQRLGDRLAGWWIVSGPALAFHDTRPCRVKAWLLGYQVSHPCYRPTLTLTCCICGEPLSPLIKEDPCQK